MGRRGHGEGSIYQRERDGMWCATVELERVNGKRRRKVIYGKTRKEVSDKKRQLERQLEQGLDVTDERQTLEQFLERWLADVVAHRVRPKTLHSYKQIARIHLVPGLGQEKVSKLSPATVQRFLTGKVAEGLSGRTIEYIRAVLSMALDQAMRWGLASRNVASLVTTPRFERATFAPLTLEQSRKLLNSIRGERLEALYHVALLLGLRRGELLGLRWEDIDLQGRTLKVCRAVVEISGKIMLSEPKTSHSRRTLPLPAVIVDVLREHRANQLLELAGDESQLGYLFATRSGTPIHPRNLVRDFHELLKRLELPQVRFHDLRHSCASMLAAAKVPARVAMEILGHSDISITMNVYTHVMNESMVEAAGIMDQLFKRRSED